MKGPPVLWHVLHTISAPCRRSGPAPFLPLPLGMAVSSYEVGVSSPADSPLPAESMGLMICEPNFPGSIGDVLQLAGFPEVVCL